MFSEAGAIDRTYAVTGVLALALVVSAVVMFRAGHSQRKAVVQAVALVEQPPPPPAPPPAEERLFETASESIDVSQYSRDTPLLDQGPAMIDSSLGVDEVGAGEGDAFGLRAKPGGRELLLTGDDQPRGGGGPPPPPFFDYAMRLEQGLKADLNRIETLRRREYVVSLALWISRGGRLERVRIDSSTGDERTDREIREALMVSQLQVEPPPEGMPQPVRLRVTARGAIRGESRTVAGARSQP
jgi:protein TonB